MNNIQINIYGGNIQVLPDVKVAVQNFVVLQKDIENTDYTLIDKKNETENN